MSTLISISVTLLCWFNTSWMRNLVVHCNPHTHTHTHTHAREKFKCFLYPVKIVPRRKSFRNNTQYREETCRFFILSSHSPQNEKGFTLCDYNLARIDWMQNRGWKGRGGGGEGRFRQTPRDTPSNQEPISGGNYCVLGHLNANLVTLHSLVYNASKRGWDPFIGILLPGSWKGSHPSRRALSLSRVRVTFYPRLKMHRAFRNEFPDTCAE